MEYVNFSQDLRKYFGITSCTVTYCNCDFMAMLLGLGSENILISTSCSNLNKEFVIKITFPSDFGKCEIEAEITDIKDSVIKVFDCKILSRNKSDFFIEFRNYLDDLIEQKKRKEERILCNKRNLELLRLNQTFNLVYRYRIHKAVIKDISYSGLKILCNSVLFQIRDETFNFTVSFNDPEEKYFFVRCPVVRKNIITFDSLALAEIVFKLPENVKYRKRLDDFFNLNKKYRTR